MTYGSRFLQALPYAAELHQSQLRKGGGVPYVTHLLAVAALVGEHGGDEDEVIAALLHDAIEDQGGDATRQDIRRRFGDRVTAIVDGCTDAEVIPKPPWRARKEAYIRHLSTASRSVRLVSLADKTHNSGSLLADLRTQGLSAYDKFTGGRDGTLWYYETLLEEFRRDPPTPALFAEYERRVAEILRLSGVSSTTDVDGARR